MIAEERQRRNLTRRELAELVRKAARADGEKGCRVNEKSIYRWERGQAPRADHLRWLNTALELSTGGDATAEALGLLRLADASDAGSGAVESTLRAVERLRRDYARTPPRLLIAEIRTRLRTVRQLLQGRLTLSQHRDLLASAGWLSLLAGTAYFDLREREPAHAYRDAALQFAKEAGHDELQAWAWETPAWFAVFDHRDRDAIDFCRVAGSVAPKGGSAKVAALLQGGRAWARLGGRPEAMGAMQQAAAALEQMPHPEHPDDHYTFDLAKFDYYAATIYVWSGNSRLAEHHARRVVADCGDPTSPNYWPTRVAFSQFDIGLALAQRGEIDAAGHEGAKAFDSPFIRGSHLDRAAELDRALLPYHEVAEVRDFRDRLAAADQGQR